MPALGYGKMALVVIAPTVPWILAELRKSASEKFAPEIDAK